MLKWTHARCRSSEFFCRAQTPPPPRRRKRRWPRILLKTAAILFVLLAIAAVVGVFWLRSAEYAALPVLDGDLHLAGLSAPVTVRRDAHGVPHIEAANEDDLFFAQGYVTAQDRLWQMDALRRNANGELAEIMGPSLLRHDRFQRTYQFRNTARRIYANLAPEDRARLDDYARGVNLFIAQHQDNLPAEFKLLFYRPQPWSGADSISIVLHDVRDAGYALVCEVLPRENRGHGCIIPSWRRTFTRWVVARPSADRHGGGLEPAAPRAPRHGH